MQSQEVVDMQSSSSFSSKYLASNFVWKASLKTFLDYILVLTRTKSWKQPFPFFFLLSPFSETLCFLEGKKFFALLRREGLSKGNERKKTGGVEGERRRESIGRIKTVLTSLSSQTHKCLIISKAEESSGFHPPCRILVKTPEAVAIRPGCVQEDGNSDCPVM